jgi:hypothetical protein
MSNSTRITSPEYSPRVPRYNLVAEDDGRVRLAEGLSVNGPIIEGRLSNLSAKGALVSLRESTARTRFLDEGEMVKIELAIPDRGRFAFFATVVRLDPSPQDEVWELGLVFRNLPGAIAAVLDRYVTTRSSDYSHPENFDYAAGQGLTHAARRLTPTRLMSFMHATVRQPLWWVAVAAFILAALSPIILPHL